MSRIEVDGAERAEPHQLDDFALEEAALALMQMQGGPGEPRRAEARVAVESYFRGLNVPLAERPEVEREPDGYALESSFRAFKHGIMPMLTIQAKPAQGTVPVVIGQPAPSVPYTSYGDVPEAVRALVEELWTSARNAENKFDWLEKTEQQIGALLAAPSVPEAGEPEHESIKKGLLSILDADNSPGDKLWLIRELANTPAARAEHAIPEGPLKEQ